MSFNNSRVDRAQLTTWVRRSRGGVYPRGAVATGAAGALEGEPGGVVRLHGGAAAGASHGSDGGHVPCLGGRNQTGVSEWPAGAFGFLVVLLVLLWFFFLVLLVVLVRYCFLVSSAAKVLEYLQDGSGRSFNSSNLWYSSMCAYLVIVSLSSRFCVVVRCCLRLLENISDEKHEHVHGIMCDHEGIRESEEHCFSAPALGRGYTRVYA